MFNWAVEGLQRLLANNRFSYEKTVEQIREQYMELSDPVFSFARKYLTNDNINFLEKDDVYHRFKQWCIENDLPVTPKNMFSKDLEKHMPSMKPGRSRVNGKLTQVYNYINWQNDDNDDDFSGNPEQQFQQKEIE